jgi:hypothetical protein
MDDVVLGIVLRLLESFPLEGRASDLLLAALDGDETLSAQLGGQAQPHSGCRAACTLRFAPVRSSGFRMPFRERAVEPVGGGTQRGP